MRRDSGSGEEAEFRVHQVRGLDKPFGVSIEIPNRVCLRGRDHGPGLGIYPKNKATLKQTHVKKA